MFITLFCGVKKTKRKRDICEKIRNIFYDGIYVVCFIWTERMNDKQYNNRRTISSMWFHIVCFKVSLEAFKNKLEGFARDIYVIHNSRFKLQKAGDRLRIFDTYTYHVSRRLQRPLWSFVHNMRIAFISTCRYCLSCYTTTINNSINRILWVLFVYWFLIYTLLTTK